MDKNKILQADLLDIIFDQRNKFYGAYQLRRTYHQRLKRSLLATLTFLSAVLSVPILTTLHPQDAIANTKTEDHIISCNFDIPEPPKPDPIIDAEPVPHQNTDAVKHVDPIIVPTETLPTDPLPTQEDLKTHASGVENIEGDGEQITDQAVINPGEDQKLSPVIDPVIPPTDETTYSTESVALDEFPSFPGGEDAMRDYLLENIEYPKMAREINKEGKVVVAFVVDKQGNIIQTKLIRSSGFGMDEEAIRVVKKMPKWNPGKIGGQPVKVEFYLPLDFSLKDN